MMVGAKGKGKSGTFKSKANKVASAANVQAVDVSPAPINISAMETEFPQPVATATDLDKSVGVSGKHAERVRVCGWLEEDNEETAEEMIFEVPADGVGREEEETLDVEEEKDAYLVYTDGSVDAPGPEQGNEGKVEVGSGGKALNSMVDGMIKEYINDVLYKEKAPSDPVTMKELKDEEVRTACEANGEAGKEENVIPGFTNIAEGKAKVKVGEGSGIKKVKKSKKILKKVVVRRRKFVPEIEREAQPLDVNKPEDKVPGETQHLDVNKPEDEIRGETQSSGNVVPESDMKEKNVTLDSTNIIQGEAKETAPVQLGEGSENEIVKKPKKILKKVSMGSENEIVKKPKKIIKKKVAVQKLKVVPKNEVEAQALDVTKPGDEVKGTSTNAEVITEQKTVERNLNVVNKSKSVGKKKVLGSTEMSAVKGINKPEKSDTCKPHAEENVTEVQPVVAKENNKEDSEGGQKSSRRRNRTDIVKAEVVDSSAKDKDKVETSNKKKSDIKAKSAGMIFMCSSKTKQDCYRYKVMGLPAAKKDVVSKVYKGMRLFLFDIDLRLLYGIYEAAGPGGYSIEPKAFKSDFPSQVRFTVLEDCLPVAEEKFKKVIRDNYYARNKFSCELSSEQVKNLCKLFRAGSNSKDKGKAIKLQQANGREMVPPVSSLRKRDRSGKRIEDEPRRDHVSRRKGFKRQARDDNYRKRARGDSYERRARDIGYERRARDIGYERRERDVSYERRARDIDYERHERDEAMRDRIHDQPPFSYERREAFIPMAAPLPVPLPPTLLQAPAPGLSYVYGNTSQPDVYLQDVAYERRDYVPRLPVDLYRQDQGLPGLEARRPGDEPELRDPYDFYRESRAFPEPVYHGAVEVRDHYEYPRAEYLPRVGIPSAVYRDAEPLYRRY